MPVYTAIISDYVKHPLRVVPYHHLSYCMSTLLIHGVSNYNRSEFGLNNQIIAVFVICLKAMCGFQNK